MAPREVAWPTLLPGALKDLNDAVRRLYMDADRPSLREIATAVETIADESPKSAPATTSRTTVHECLTTAELPPRLVLISVVTALAWMAHTDPEQREVRLSEIVRLWQNAARAPLRGRRVASFSGVELGLHRPIEPEHADADVAADGIPSYVPRAHDAELRARIRAAAHAAQPILIIIRGQPATGKTRSAYEAVRQELPEWRLLRPSTAQSLMDTWNHGQVSEHTLVWLNDLHVHLQDPQGQRAAALLFEALGHQGGPAIFLGTLWPDTWNALTAPEPDRAEAPDRAYHSRRLLTVSDPVEVPDSFNPAEREVAVSMAAQDPWWSTVFSQVPVADQLAQHIAGAPAALDRFLHPPSPYCRAVLAAAADAARLGVRGLLTRNFLKAASTGYLHGREAVDPPKRWFTEALRDACQLLNGAASALEPHRVRPGVGKADGYRLTDYLYVRARDLRTREAIPGSWWEAAIRHLARADDCLDVARGAHARGLLGIEAALLTPSPSSGWSTTEVDNALHQLAWRLREAGRTAEALPFYLGRLDEANDHSMMDIGTCYAELGDVDQAVHWYVRASERGYDRPFYAAFHTLREAERLEDAEKLLRSAPERGFWIPSRFLANLCEQTGRLDEAEEILRAGSVAGERRVMPELVDFVIRHNRQAATIPWLSSHAGPGAEWARTALKWIDGESTVSIPPTHHGGTEPWAMCLDLRPGLTNRLLTYVRGRAQEVRTRIRELEGAGHNEAAEQLLIEESRQGRYFPGLLLPFYARQGRWGEVQTAWEDLPVSSHRSTLLPLLTQLLLASNRTAQAELLAREVWAEGMSDAEDVLLHLLQEDGRKAEADQIKRYGVEPGTTAWPNATAETWVAPWQVEPGCA
ncbi:hypothetical protein [Streptomyces sp. NPDC058086]|uniref:hypothetical protein n=1 Tax=Streptomyces sp. NPDC058086 TaxID=3346334 RepID=UPI0036E183CA